MKGQPLVVINREPSRKDLFWFGVALPAFFVLVGFIVARRTGSSIIPAGIWALGAALSLVYAVVPRARQPIFVGWSYAAYPVGWAITNLLLTLIFWLVITPIGILVRLFADDPLARRPDDSAESYWTPSERNRDIRSYLQQF